MIPLLGALAGASMAKDVIGGVLNAGMQLIGAPGNQGNQGESRNNNFLGGMLG